MTQAKTQEIQEKSQVIEIDDLNNLVLTQNGVVVGFVTVKRYYSGAVEFSGRAINVIDYSSGVITIHGFSASNSIRTTDAQEVANVQNFYDAMTKAGK